MTEASKSQFREEHLLRWGFLDDETESCAVVSDRMELVYMNEAARGLVPIEWFGRRCFEVFPTADELCALHCPTVTAVHESHEILYCKEVLRTADGGQQELGVAVIPLEGASDDEARAVLLLRAQEEKEDESSKAELLERARDLKTTVLAHFER